VPAGTTTASAAIPTRVPTNGTATTLPTCYGGQCVPNTLFISKPTTCTPTTCAAQGKNCGTIADGCGGTLTCGSCTAPQTCGGRGVANVCATACTQTTCAAQGKNCGTIPNGRSGTLSCGPR